MNLKNNSGEFECGFDQSGQSPMEAFFSLIGGVLRADLERISKFCVELRQAAAGLSAFPRLEPLVQAERTGWQRLPVASGRSARAMRYESRRGW